MATTTQDARERSRSTSSSSEKGNENVIYVRISKDLKSKQLRLEGSMQPNQKKNENDKKENGQGEIDNDLNKKKSNMIKSKENTFDSAITAEILWTLKTVTSGYSFRSCYGLSSLFQNMFPDSKVASNFSYTKDKFSYLLCHGIAPYFQELLKQDLKRASYYAITLDGNYEQTPNEQVELNITFWNNNTNKAETRYLNSVFLLQTGVDDLLTSFYETTRFLDSSKLLQVSMTGAWLNWKFLKTLGVNREIEKQPKLINIGNCDAEMLHGAFKDGADKTGWRFKEILTSLFDVLHETPVSRSNYADVTGSTVLPRRFNNTNWLENGLVAQRAIDIWDNVCQFMSFWESLPFTQRTTTQNILIVQELIKDKIIVAKLHFFCYLAKVVKSFLSTYQVSKPMVPFIYDDLYNLVLKLMSWFINSAVLCEASTAETLCAINLHDKNNYLKVNNINIGFGAENYLRFCLRKERITENDIRTFKEGCIIFLVELIEKIRKQSCLRSSVARNAGSINPVKMAAQSDSSSMLFSQLIEKLKELRWLSSIEADEVLIEYETYLIKVVASNKEKFETFSKTDDRIDMFYFTEGCLKDYPILSNVIRMILCTNHGQNATKKHSYYQNEFMFDSQINETCIRSERIVKDYMDARKLSPDAYIVSNELISRFKDVREKYHHCMNEMRVKQDEIRGLGLINETDL